MLYASVGANAYLSLSAVGAMFYISPTLTFMMLGIVPPVSLGAVRLFVLSASVHNSWIDL